MNDHDRPKENPVVRRVGDHPVVVPAKPGGGARKLGPDPDRSLAEELDVQNPEIVTTGASAAATRWKRDRTPS